jgi:CheY-like chemotaxis protein
MSEVMPVSALPADNAGEKRVPTVYFIDDSATMREVIKIAFRRESINVITCADAASAFAQFEQTPPDTVITDVIMPDQDGYSVCTQIKQNPQFSAVPVLLMSGVVNKTVADKAVSVQADELIRKPFQPQELIGRVKTLLGLNTPVARPSSDRSASSPLANLFTSPPAPRPAASPVVPSPAMPPADQHFVEYAWPRALAEAFTPQPVSATPAAQNLAQHSPANPFASPSVHSPSRPMPGQVDAQKLRGEIARLELLIKKLQTELQIERQYNQALEQHVQNLTRSE